MEQFYDNRSTREFYDRLWTEMPLEFQGVMEHMRRVFPEGVAGKSVLDAGFGSAMASIAFAKLGANVTGVEIGEANVLNARQRAREFGVENISFSQADLRTLDLSQQFDIVYCWGVLMHTGDAKKSFDRLVLHTRKDGRLLVAVYLKTWLSGFWNFTRTIYRLLPRFLQWMIIYAGSAFLWLYDLIRFRLMKQKPKELRGASYAALIDDWFGVPVRTFHAVADVFGWYHEHGMEARLLEAETGRFKSSSNFEVIGWWPNS